MPDERLEKAELIELDADFSSVKSGGKQVDVQFNPETLKVTSRTSSSSSERRRQARQRQARQFVGAGTTKLALQLWFDVTGARGRDGRRRAQADRSEVALLHHAAPAGRQQGAAAAGVRFVWGSFSVRRHVGLARGELRVLLAGRPPAARQSPSRCRSRDHQARVHHGAGTAPAARPATAHPGAGGRDAAGLGRAGAGARWQAIAAANGIEDPLRLAPGAAHRPRAQVRVRRRCPSSSTSSRSSQPWPRS